MNEKTEKVKVKIIDVEVEVSQAYYQAAKDELSKFKAMYPYDRFIVDDSEIVATIAYRYNREGKVTNQRSLINSFVKVFGKGWTSA